MKNFSMYLHQFQINITAKFYDGLPIIFPDFFLFIWNFSTFWTQFPTQTRCKGSNYFSPKQLYCGNCFQLVKILDWSPLCRLWEVAMLSICSAQPRLWKSGRYTRFFYKISLHNILVLKEATFQGSFPNIPYHWFWNKKMYE